MREMKLPFGVSRRSIFGGPFRERPREYVGIKVAAEIRDKCDMAVPIIDFQVPVKPDKMNEALAFAIIRLAEGMPIYVGCMGGIGRTGLFMSLLIKALTGKPGPECIDYVRATFNEHAVETQQQKDYVSSFDVTNLRKLARKSKFKAFWIDLKAVFGIKPEGAQTI